MLFVLSIVAIIISLLIIMKSSKNTAGKEKGIATLVLAVSLTIGLFQCVKVIPAGHVGVVDFFGNVSDKTLKSGINFVNPLAKIIKFSIKTQESKEIMNVPSKEGLNVQLEVSLLYALDPEKASLIYKTVGENYPEIILVPQFRSVVRGVTAKYEAQALYTSTREKLAGEIKEELSALVNPRGILIENVPLRQVILPAGLTQAIEEKLKAEQESQRMAFVLQREAQEAERKRIEAKGIADFQEIVSKGISEQLLKWKGIEATEKLANSSNAKIVIVGAGKDGLPIILGGN
jgi:regulator of protease activity HflC (stomatin/prohibitin superfamily)